MIHYETLLERRSIMEQIRIVGVAPNDNLRIMMEDISNSYPNIKFTCFTGDLLEGANTIKNYDLDTIDVVISRGGTALLLKKLFNIPIVEVHITVYDILRAVYLAKYHMRKKAIVGFKNITEKATILCDLLEIEYDIVTINDKDSARDILLQLKNQDFEVIICDTVTSLIATELNLNPILIGSNEESINAAFNRAIEIGKSQVTINKENKLLNQINHYSPFKIIVLDNKLNLMKHISSDNIPKDLINTSINNYKKKNFSSTSSIKTKYRNSLYSITYQHELFVRTNYHVFYIDKTNLDLAISNSISEYTALDVSEDIKKNFLNIFSIMEKNLQNEIIAYSKSKEPILIYGEKGTPITELIKIVFSNTEYNSSLWIIDCSSISSSTWQTLFSSTKSPLTNTGITICLKNLQDLSLEDFKYFQNYSEDTLLFKRCKIICAYEYKKSDDSLNMLENIKHKFLNLKIPSLRENKSILYSLITLYVNESNNLYGKNVIGFEPEALNIFANYNWPENHLQLNRIIKQLVLQTRGSFIHDKNVTYLLNNEKIPLKENENTTYFYDKSLEEINYEIIKYIIEEEGNQTKAAERLGISRSTIWRILKKYE